MFAQFTFQYFSLPTAGQNYKSTHWRVLTQISVRHEKYWHMCKSQHEICEEVLREKNCALLTMLAQLLCPKIQLWDDSDSDLAKVPPGDGDSVGDIGEMQPGSDVYRAARTTGFNARLIRGVISLEAHNGNVKYSETEMNDKHDIPTIKTLFNNVDGVSKSYFPAGIRQLLSVVWLTERSCGEFV